MSSIYYPTSRPRFSFEHALLSIFFGLFFFGLAAAAFVIGYQLWYGGRIFPGVKVAGIDVGGMSAKQAASLIATEVTYPVDGKVLLRDGDRLWKTTPAELGLYLDPAESARRAYEVGRTGFFIEQIKEQYATWYWGRDLPPIFILDERATHLFLTGLAREINVPTVEASIDLNGTQVEVHPGQVGRSLNVPKTMLLVSLQLQTMQDSVINVFINESAPVIMDASAQAAIAEKMLSAPLTLTLPAEDPDQAGPWTIEPQTLATMLAFERVQTEQGEQYQIRIKTDPLRTYLQGVAPDLKRGPLNAALDFNDSTNQVEIVKPAVIGRELDLDGTVTAIQEKLQGGEHAVQLAMTYTNPQITDQASAQALGIKELIHSESSYFYGSTAARVQNITAAASKFNGVLVAPGETFSMANTIGDITLDNGYAEALIILGGQTIKGVGGGVCQVSTTLFRAAFFTGFPIVERHAHAYRVYYYEQVAGGHNNPDFAGLDATVFVPLVDFKFLNDTPYWLLMETVVDPASSRITWNFYSTSDGRTVEWDSTGPTNIVKPPAPIYRENPDLANGEIRQVDYAAQGADVTVNRRVLKGGAVYLEDTIYTHYEAWPDAYEYGPGSDIPNNNNENQPQG